MFYLKKGILESFQLIKKHKHLVMALIILQAIFFATLIYAGIHYQMEIYDNVINILGPLEEANYDAASITEGNPFLKDVAAVSENYRILKNNLFQFVLWALGSFLIINGLSWMLVHQLFQKVKLTKTWLKFFISSVIIMIPFVLLGHYIVNMSVLEVDLSIILLKSLGIASLIFYYLLLVGFAFINVNSWQNYFKNIFKIGIKKIHYVFPVLLIKVILIILSSLLIYYTIIKEELFVLSLVALTVFVTVSALTKIMWVSCLKEIK